ncbi:hypothetical protein J1N35_030197 [Gossypium stocksii]|uniref:Retrotransposon gag domain-containing protein n=1 Tax=Gossypium stocksii TaxID=47602 RepID=A0A9D3UZM0_9ROSI|nr:hypothetical protein J1N35_030197 [Gossypium stocksii]
MQIFRLQREVGHLQQEIAQLQVELTQMDTKFDSRMNELRDRVQDEIKSELQSLFEHYLGHLSFTTIVGSSQDKGKDYRGWCSKLDRYFEAEGVVDNVKVRTIMLHLKGKDLDWHHFYTQRQGGFHLLTSDSYSRSLKDWFASNSFRDPMADLVSLKQVNSVDQYHDEFVSLLNHLNLPENYALSTFISNLKLEMVST